MSGQSGFVDRKGMLLTTRTLFEKLEKHGKLPKESSDPGAVKDMKFRYFRLYQELNMGQPHMSQFRFMNNFFKLYDEQYKYNIYKAQRLHCMKQIEQKLESQVLMD